MIPTNSISFLKSTSTRRLLPSEIVFSRVSFENRDQAAFRMEPVFPVDEVFGLAYISEEEIRITALYDLHRHCPLNTLDFIVEAEGKEYHYEYMLTKTERKLLEDKMDGFFFKRTGIRLADFTLESRAGESPYSASGTGRPQTPAVRTFSRIPFCRQVPEKYSVITKKPTLAGFFRIPFRILRR